MIKRTLLRLVHYMMVLSAGISFLLIACGTNTKLTNPIISDSVSMAFGTDETFDIVTWNIENFPKHNPETSNLLKSILPNLKVECIAIQEVKNTYAFHQLINSLEGWSYRISGMGDTQTAIIYNTASVLIDSSTTIFTNMSNPFPRPPLLVRVNWMGQEIIIISIHLKAYGDNYIDETNPNDEEIRRRYACQLLDEYITNSFPETPVIVLGDMNDQIQEPASTNVFMSFINKSDEYLFTDMTLAQNLVYENCSYPRYASHIDHVLITNELFPAFSASNQYTITINIENYITGGWVNYYKYISDHRPVISRFRFERNVEKYK